MSSDDADKVRYVQHHSHWGIISLTTRRRIVGRIVRNHDGLGGFFVFRLRAGSPEDLVWVNKDAVRTIRYLPEQRLRDILAASSSSQS